MGECASHVFFYLQRHGSVRLAACVPEVRVADPAFNASQILALLKSTSERAACIAVFPELGLTAYSCEDLFHQQPLLVEAERALAALLKLSASLPIVGIIGMPVAVDSLLYNCALVYSERRRGHGLARPA